MIYLDYQATTPLAPEAFDAMLPWLRDRHANPHSAHRPGRAAKAAVEVARDQVAALLPPGGRVVFTGGATEALNWAIKGTTGPITTLATEHAATLDTVAAEGAEGRGVTVLPVGEDGLASVPAQAGTQGSARSAWHPALLLPQEREGGLWAAMLVNNEIGVIQPVEALADLAHAAGALLLCDAVQGLGRVPIPGNVDLIALSAHKIHGPKGIGALWIRDGVTLTPLLHGGDQEGGRSGTLSPALCAGFGVAAQLMAAHATEDAAHVQRLWDIAADRLAFPPSISPPPPFPGESRSPVGTHPDPEGSVQQRGSPCLGPGFRRGAEWVLNGSIDPRYHGNLNIRRDGLDVARLMSDCRDLAFSAGSACASGSGRPSHVLRALRLGDAQARSSIRLGWGRYTTEDDLIQALDQIIELADAQWITA